MTATPAEYSYSALEGAGFAGRRQFKKHKVLPRPQADKNYGLSLTVSRARPTTYDLVIDTTQAPRSGSQPTSPQTSKHHSERVGSGPDLPPTPPNHSRNSSSSQSAQTSSPTAADPIMMTPRNVPDRNPTTPPNQQSPPTPDVTPPQPVTRPKALRPALTVADRGISRTTTAESRRTDSFKTAREEPQSSSSDDDGRSTVLPAVVSTKTSQSTIRRIPQDDSNQILRPQDLGLAIDGLSHPIEDNCTPRTRGKIGQSDGDRAAGEAEQKRDGNSQSFPEASTSLRADELNTYISDEVMVPPTDATKAVRQMSLQDHAIISPSPKATDQETASLNHSLSEVSTNVDVKRVSGYSTRSTISTVVEAILVDAPPRRQRTLRHVRKQTGLRDCVQNISDMPVNVPRMEKSLRDGDFDTRPRDSRHTSFASNTTVNSISSGKARREVRRNGGIPVVVVPDRQSSNNARSSREPSLRSTSSRRSKKTASPSSDGPTPKEVGPVFERPSRRSRALSNPDPFDQRTMDYAPVVPRRSSSLSAPTSRNASRASSMTAESNKAHEALLHSSDTTTTQEKKPSTEGMLQPGATIEPMGYIGSEHDEMQRKPSVDRNEDHVSGKGYPMHATPFSVASVETNGTAPEVSEAMAVHMYAHQNSSVLMVDHSTRPSETSEDTQKDKEFFDEAQKPRIVMTAPDGEGPVTPPQTQFCLDDVDSPLRNPRAPPEPPAFPPAINFIPATPSGLTPAHDKIIQMGNYFEATGEKPPRRPSIVRRALSRRRNSVEYPPTTSKAPGFLTRTFSLSRNVRKDTNATSRGLGNPNIEDAPTYPTEDDTPAEGNKLHPFWRPQWPNDDSEDDSSDFDENDRVYRYPPVDNRPRGAKRSLSARMKRTFAILPRREDDYYLVDDLAGPERRTIRRTPSGNLRVMRHRASLDSLRQSFKNYEQMQLSPNSVQQRLFWLGNGMKRPRSREGRRFSIGSKLEELQSLPRRLSQRRREKRTQALRQKISGPRDVRDGVGDMIRWNSGRVQQSRTGRV